MSFSHMLFAGAAAIAIATPAFGAVHLSCDKFKKNTDGSWSPTTDITLTTDDVDLTAGPGTKFVRGAHFGRLDLYAILEGNCRR